MGELFTINLWCFIDDRPRQISRSHAEELMFSMLCSKFSITNYFQSNKTIKKMELFNRDGWHDELISSWQSCIFFIVFHFVLRFPFDSVLVASMIKLNSMLQLTGESIYKFNTYNAGNTFRMPHIHTYDTLA